MIVLRKLLACLAVLLATIGIGVALSESPAHANRLINCTSVTGSSSYSTKCTGTNVSLPGLGQQRANTRCVNPWLGTNRIVTGPWVGVGVWSSAYCAPNEYPAAPKFAELR